MDFWWFLHSNHEELWTRPDPSRGVPLNDVKYGKDGFKAVLKEANDWIHMSPTDSYRCEAALSRGDREVSVLSGRLAAVDLELMQLEPIYWPGSRCPVRRTQWFIVGVGSSVVPCPNILASILEAKYESVSEWVQTNSSSESAVEKVVDLERPFHEHMMIVKGGMLDSVTLHPITRTTFDSSKFTMSGVQIIRGYSNVIRMFPNLSLPAPLTVDPEDEPPEHLFLAVHGIGQKFAGKYGYGFVRDTNFLRDQFEIANKQSKRRAGSIAILPIHWRLDLKLPAQYYKNEKVVAMSGFDLVLSRLVPPSVPLIRSLFSDVALDILLYMAPKHRNLIINVLLKELKRIHALFLHWNPKFTGKTHLFGHSLGSTIVADMLANNLCPFPVDHFFAVGSPAPVFFLLKHQRPVGCVATAKKPHIADEEPEPVVFACNYYYNIYHPNDPIAYRMEPLVDEEMAILMSPVSIPYQKPGLTRLKMDIDERIGKAKEDFSTAMRSLASFTSRLSFTSSTDLIQPAQTEPSDHKTHGIYHAFNRHGRIDYCLQDSLMESAYFSSLTAHFTYWSDLDVAMFIVNQIS